MVDKSPDGSGRSPPGELFMADNSMRRRAMVYLGVAVVITIATGKVIHTLALPPHSAVEASPVQEKQSAPEAKPSKQNTDFNPVNDGSPSGSE
jgi:hypothetical protein